MWCYYYTMWGWNIKYEEKKKGITKCDKSTVKCYVGIAECDNGIIKCEKKNKGTTKCDKRKVICDIGTIQCEDETIEKKIKEPQNMNRSIVTCDIGTIQCDDETVKCEEKKIRKPPNVTKLVTWVVDYLGFFQLKELMGLIFKTYPTIYIYIYIYII